MVKLEIRNRRKKEGAEPGKREKSYFFCLSRELLGNPFYKCDLKGIFKMKSSQWRLVRSDRAEGLIARGYSKIILLYTKCLPSLKMIFIFYAKIAMLCNYDVDHYMGPIILLNCEDLSMIVKCNMASQSCNWVHGYKHRLDQLLGSPRKCYLSSCLPLDIKT